MYVHGQALEVDLTYAIRGTSLKLAHLVVVPAVTDLDTETLDAKSLIVWLFVVANGLCTVTSRAP